MSKTTPPILDKLAYTIDNFALAVDMSRTAIRDHISTGNLVVSYPNRRPIITREEGERWLRSLPNDYTPERAS